MRGWGRGEGGRGGKEWGAYSRLTDCFHLPPGTHLFRVSSSPILVKAAFAVINRSVVIHAFAFLKPFLQEHP